MRLEVRRWPLHHDSSVLLSLQDIPVLTSSLTDTPRKGHRCWPVDCQAQFSLRETDKAKCRLSAVTNVPSACTADGLQVAFISAPSWAT